MITTNFLATRLRHSVDMLNAVLKDLEAGMDGDKAVEKHFDSIILAMCHLATIAKDGIANKNQ